MVRRRSTDPAQTSFFDQPQPPAGLAGFGLRLREALVETLAQAKERGLDRFDIAAEMSRLDPEREVSKAMLDRYCAPSSAEWRFPAEALPTLYRVTGDARLLNLIAGACDHKVVPSEAAALGELMLIQMEKRRLAEREEAAKRRVTPEGFAWAQREAARRSK